MKHSKPPDWTSRPMKLIFCTECHDIVKLHSDPTACMCGKSGGRYVDDLNAEIYGKAVPLGIANGSFVRALENRPESGLGKRFDAFVIPHQCDTVKESQ